MARAAIAGASGLVGSHLLPLLLSEYDQVAALTRRPLGVSAPNLLELDFERDPLPDQTDVAFCCLGARIVMRGARKAFREIDLDASVAFAHAVKQKGARAFALITSVEADLRSPLYYLRVKAQAEKAIESLSFDSLTILRPSFLVGKRQVSRPEEWVPSFVTRACGFLLRGSLSRYHAVDAALVAQAAHCSALASRPGCRILHYNDMIAIRHQTVSQ
jgi:uncharacterized protein YbjT (DUF2867 family)